MRNERYARVAYSLIEVLVAISISTVVFATAIQFIHVVFKSQASARNDLRLQQAIRRASWQFREDAHAANALASKSDDEEKADEMVFSLPDGVVVSYQAVPGRLIRSVRHRDQLTQNDEIAFPHQVTVELTSSDRDRVIMRICQPRFPALLVADGNDAFMTVHATRATVGRDARFTSPSRTPKE